MADVTSGRGPLDAASEVVDRVVSALGEVFESTRDQAGALVDRFLDSMFDERYEVPDRHRAVELLISDPGADSEVARYVRGAVGSRLVGYVARLLAGSRLSRIFRLTPTRLGMTLALGRAQLAVQRVLHDARVLSSYLHAQARGSDMELARPAIRAAVTSVLVDDRKRVDRRNAGPRGGLAMVRAMLNEAANPPNAPARRTRAERLLDALDATDLRALSADVDG
jgi:hypothetical protein